MHDAQKQKTPYFIYKPLDQIYIFKSHQWLYKERSFHFDATIVFPKLLTASSPVTLAILLIPQFLGSSPQAKPQTSRFQISSINLINVRSIPGHSGHCIVLQWQFLSPSRSFSLTFGVSGCSGQLTMGRYMCLGLVGVAGNWDAWTRLCHRSAPSAGGKAVALSARRGSKRLVQIPFPVPRGRLRLPGRPHSPEARGSPRGNGLFHSSVATRLGLLKGRGLCLQLFL